MEDIAVRLQRLEDIEAIRGLKARYCRAVDERDAAAWAALFTEDAIWDGGRFGRYEGFAEVRRYFEQILQNLAFTIHYVMNPVIRVDGDRAHGTWYLFEPCTMAEGSEPVWGAGSYEEDYVRTGDGWKIRLLTLTSSFWTPYAQGWVAKPIWNE